MTVVHHGFEMSSREFEACKAFPVPGRAHDGWSGEYASQSPLGVCFLAREAFGSEAQARSGGGAEGTAGYVALPGAHADQFYFEATPWWTSARHTYDLRDTRASLYLKAITPIRTAPGYEPHLFIDDYNEDAHDYCGWYLNRPLEVGDDWTLNPRDLVNDPAQWMRYSSDRPLDAVLSRVGFIGVMYLRGTDFRGVDACGILGIDELRFNLPRG